MVVAGGGWNTAAATAAPQAGAANSKRIETSAMEPNATDSEDGSDARFEVDPSPEEMRSVSVSAKRARSPEATSDPVVARLRSQRRATPLAGVVRIRRIPPGMSTSDIRRLLERHGRIGRLYVRKERDYERRERIQRGGTRRRRALEGWIEFLDHRVAKQVAALLNATPMDPQNRRSRFHDDLWCLEYVPALQWHHLTDQMAATRRERILRIKNEVQASRRERDLWLEQLNKARMLTAVQQRHQERTMGKQEQLEITPPIQNSAKLPPQRHRRADDRCSPAPQGKSQHQDTQQERGSQGSYRKAVLERILRQIANPGSS